MRAASVVLMSVIAGCHTPTCPEGAILIPPGTFEMGSNEELNISLQTPEAARHFYATVTKPKHSEGETNDEGGG